MTEMELRLGAFYWLKPVGLRSDNCPAKPEKILVKIKGIDQSLAQTVCQVMAFDIATGQVLDLTNCPAEDFDRQLTPTEIRALITQIRIDQQLQAREWAKQSADY